MFSLCSCGFSLRVPYFYKAYKSTGLEHKSAYRCNYRFDCLYVSQTEHFYF